MVISSERENQFRNYDFIDVPVSEGWGFGLRNFIRAYRTENQVQGFDLLEPIKFRKILEQAEGVIEKFGKRASAEPIELTKLNIIQNDLRFGFGGTENIPCSITPFEANLLAHILNIAANPGLEAAALQYSNLIRPDLFLSERMLLAHAFQVTPGAEGLPTLSLLTRTETVDEIAEYSHLIMARLQGLGKLVDQLHEMQMKPQAEYDRGYAAGLENQNEPAGRRTLENARQVARQEGFYQGREAGLRDGQFQNNQTARTQGRAEGEAEERKKRPLWLALGAFAGSVVAAATTFFIMRPPETPKIPDKEKTSEKRSADPIPVGQRPPLTPDIQQPITSPIIKTGEKEKVTIFEKRPKLGTLSAEIICVDANTLEIKYELEFGYYKQEPKKFSHSYFIKPPLFKEGYIDLEKGYNPNSVGHPNYFVNKGSNIKETATGLKTRFNNWYAVGGLGEQLTIQTLPDLYGKALGGKIPGGYDEFDLFFSKHKIKCDPEQFIHDIGSSFLERCVVDFKKSPKDFEKGAIIFKEIKGHFSAGEITLAHEKLVALNEIIPRIISEIPPPSILDEELKLDRKKIWEGL